MTAQICVQISVVLEGPPLKWVRGAGVNYVGFLNALDVSACIF